MVFRSATAPLLLFACALLAAGADAGVPGVGAHAISYYALSANDSTLLSTPPMATRFVGSTMIVGVGRGEYGELGTLPVDNKGNGTYLQAGAAHAYTSWRNSGTALYTCPAARGGGGHVVTAGTSPWQELTMAAVEVTNGGIVKDFKWNEVLTGNPLTSQSVTTTGPAVLVAFWWGDGAQGPHTATPDNGFTVVESVTSPDWVVQCAVATRVVSAAGTYNGTWTATPEQGAQMWLVAVQAGNLSPVPGAGDAIALRQNQPNPFNPATTITYDIPAGAAGHASLRVYDVAGRAVATLLDGDVQAGEHAIRFDARDLASGTYFYRLMVEPDDASTPRFEQARSMILLR